MRVALCRVGAEELAHATEGRRVRDALQEDVGLGGVGVAVHEDVVVNHLAELAREREERRVVRDNVGHGCCRDVSLCRWRIGLGKL